MSQSKWVSIILFLKWINKAGNAKKKKQIKLIPCAFVCENDKKMVNIGISIVPPPIPIPPITPARKPNKINKKIVIYITIFIPAASIIIAKITLITFPLNFFNKTAPRAPPTKTPIEV